MRSPALLLVPAILVASFLLLAGCAAPAGSTDPAGQTPGAPQATPVQGPVVSARAYPPAEPYEIDPRFVRNTPEYRVDPALFTEVYRNRFTLSYNTEGLLATVDKAPLVIDFTTTPGHANPNYCFFILTVRDADSGTVIGQEGYARTFSTENPKRMVFTRPGKYHLNLYGNWVDIDLGIRMKS